MYGIIAEDDSDVACLKILIKRLANNESIAIKDKGYKGCANMVRDGWNQLKTYDKLGIRRFIICYDRDKTATQKRYEEVVSKIIKPSGIKKSDNLICILIPTEEIEAWILADLKAVSNVISSWQPKQTFSNPEAISNPKEELKKLSREGKPKPLYRHEIHNEQVMKYLDLEIVKKKCPSFVELAKFVEKDIANYPKIN